MSRDNSHPCKRKKQKSAVAGLLTRQRRRARKEFKMWFKAEIEKTN